MAALAANGLDMLEAADFLQLPPSIYGFGGYQRNCISIRRQDRRDASGREQPLEPVNEAAIELGS